MRLLSAILSLALGFKTCEAGGSIKPRASALTFTHISFLTPYFVVKKQGKLNILAQKRLMGKSKASARGRCRHPR